MTSHATIKDEIERFRELTVAARSSDDVGAEADEILERLKQLFVEDKEQFTPEDIRWLNKLRGYLGARLAAHGPVLKNIKKAAKRKGDAMDHCWRCETIVDERFTEICPTCSSKPYQFRICPVCQACGCQKSGRVLV